jgi:hypothetical protein
MAARATSASCAALSRGRAGAAMASTIWPANSGKASSAAAISATMAAMKSARRHCRRQRLAAKRKVRRNGSLARTGLREVIGSMPHPAGVVAPQTE